MQNYKLKYNRNLVQHLIKLRVKQNKPFNDILKDVIKKGYKHIDVVNYENEIKRFIINLHLNDGQSIKDLTTNQKILIHDSIEYTFDDLENIYYTKENNFKPSDLQYLLDKNN